MGAGGSAGTAAVPVLSRKRLGGVADGLAHGEPGPVWRRSLRRCLGVLGAGGGVLVKERAQQGVQVWVVLA